MLRQYWPANAITWIDANILMINGTVSTPMNMTWLPISTPQYWPQDRGCLLTNAAYDSQSSAAKGWLVFFLAHVLNATAKIARAVKTEASATI